MNDQQQFKNELRKDTGPDFDFDRMESALMARVAKDSSRRKLRARVSMGIGALAMAAAAAFVVARSPHFQGVEVPGGAGVALADPGAGELESGSQVSVIGAGGSSNDKHVLGRGERLKRGDEVETSRAVFRASGRVVFAVSGVSSGSEPARMSVTATDRPIVLSLSRGVVEAQVDKVASGEAFAVDVTDTTGNDSVRIAVHGTHLRVARENGHVTLDLTEGIVNVGRPPKSGSTYGKLVTAPAHVEFDVASLETSFTMTKDLDKVRVAEDLSPVVTGSLEPSPLAPQVTSPVQPSREGATAKGAPGVAQVQAPQAVALNPNAPNTPNAPKDPGVVQAPAEPRVDARTAINDAIAACALEKLRNGSRSSAGTTAAPTGANAITVTLNSTLSLRVGDDGYVQAARFEPPLDPAVQKCAASTIYKVHFTETNQASVMMPISLKTPSP